MHMAKIYLHSMDSTTLANLTTALTNLGHTVTAAATFNRYVDYLQYDLVFLAHYTNQDISYIKKLVVDRGIPLIFSSQANVAGDVTTAEGSLAVALGLAAKETTNTNFITYAGNDYDSCLSSAGLTVPYQVGSNSGYSSYLASLAANFHAMGYTSSTITTNVNVAVFKTGNTNNAGTTINCNIAFIGNVGQLWNNTTSWQSFIGAIINYLFSKTIKYKVAGDVADAANNLIARTVAVYNRDTLALVGTQVSTSGQFSIRVDNVPTQKYFAVCLDDAAGNISSLIVDKLLPAVY